MYSLLRILFIQQIIKIMILKEAYCNLEGRKCGKESWVWLVTRWPPTHHHCQSQSHTVSQPEAAEKMADDNWVFDSLGL